LISRTDREFIVFVRGREEQALFIRYPGGEMDKTIAGCTEDDVKISFGQTGDRNITTYSFPDIDNYVKREFDSYVTRIMEDAGGN
jgi:hypothetical protein